jgi:hypothetical protein
MTKQHTKDTDKDETPKFNPNRPIAGASQKPVDRETMSHQYQENSPAIDTNVLSEHPNKELNGSVLDKIETKENLKSKEDAAKQSAEDNQKLYQYDDENIDCSKRDVSDPLYCTPGSERHTKHLKKGK